VPGAVEQLRYTWAPRGVEGVNRFQIAGISPGFKTGEAAGALSSARALCRYDPPRGRDETRPVSYGWIDQGPYRIAFQRIALPAGTDRAGNFAAHLLVGKPEALPAATLAAAFGSPLWWRGITPEERAEIADGKRDFELPMVELEEFAATAPDPDCGEEATMALLYALLHLPAADRLAVSAEGEELARALGSVARLLPEALAGLTVSTYEAKAIFPFRLLGTAEPAPQMRSCELRLPESLGEGERRALMALSGTGAAAGELRHVVGRAGGGAAGEAPARMWDTALLLVDLESGRENGGAPDHNLLTDPEVASYLARSPAGRETLAGWAFGGGIAVLQAIKNAGKRMETVCREALYAAMGDRFATAEDLRGSSGAVAAMAPGPARQAALDQLLEAAKDERLAATLGPEDAVTVVAWAGERQIEATAIRPLLRGASGHIGPCAGERAIPDSYLATMFEASLTDRSAPGAVAEAVRVRPGFLSAVAIDGAEASACVDLLARLDLNSREAALGVLLPQLLQGEAEDRARRLLLSMPPTSAGQAILAARTRGLGSSEQVDGLCDQLGALLVERKSAPLAQRLLAESGSADGVLATALLRRLADGRQMGPAQIAVEAQAIQQLDLRQAVRGLALDHAFVAARSLGAVAALWGALATIFPGESPEVRLRRLLGMGMTPPPEAARAIVLAWVGGDLLAREEDLLNRLGSLKDDEAETAAMALAKSIDPEYLAEIAPPAENIPKRARKWWRRVEGQSKKRPGD
jgi:hypothetical protein